MLERRERPSESEAAIVEAISVAEVLAKRYPDRDGFLSLLPDVICELAELQHRLKRPTESEASFRKATLTYESLLRDRPDLQSVRERLAKILETCPIRALRDPPRAKALREGQSSS
jgi:hypothetical protein